VPDGGDSQYRHPGRTFSEFTLDKWRHFAVSVEQGDFDGVVDADDR
jgi:hypothetical protein